MPGGPLESLIKKIPGGPRVQVFAGSFIIIGICAIPVFGKPKEKRGHDLFSQEKPEAVLASQEQLIKNHRAKQKREREENNNRS